MAYPPKLLKAIQELAPRFGRSPVLKSSPELSPGKKFKMRETKEEPAQGRRGNFDLKPGECSFCGATQFQSKHSLRGCIHCRNTKSDNFLEFA